MIEHKTKTWPSGIIQTVDAAQFAAEKCGRQEVDIDWLMNHETMCDAPAFLYVKSYANYGMDPWILLDGIDRAVDHSWYSVWPVSGQERRFNRDTDRLFVQKSDLEKRSH